MANEDDDLKYLSYTLPEDIQRRLYRGGVDVEDVFGGGRERTDEDLKIGWGDVGRGLASSSIGVAADMAADVEYISRGNLGTETRQALSKLSEEQLEQASFQFRRALGSAFLPSEGEESVFDVGLTDAIIAKGIMTVPSLVAAVLPVGVVNKVLKGASLATRAAAGSVAAQGTASAINMGSLARDMYSEVDKLSDEELAKKSSVFNGYLLMGMDPKEARRMFRNDVAGVAPIAAAAITYATGGFEGLAGRALAGDKLGFLKGFGQGALKEGGQEFAENASNELMKQEALSQFDLGEKDFTKVLNAAVEGIALGGLIGGPLGGLTNIGGGAKKAPKGTTGDATLDAGLPVNDTAFPASTAPTGTQLTPTDEENAILQGMNERLPAEKAELGIAPGSDIAPDQEEALRGFTDEEDREASGFWFNQETPNNVVRGRDTGMNTQEDPRDLDEQQWQLMNGQRPAMLYPRGTQERPVPPGMGFVETDAGMVHFNPDLIDKPTIEFLSARGRENEFLGLGPFNKQDVLSRASKTGEPLVAVTETTPQGATARSAIGTTGTAPVQQAEIQKVASPGNSVQVEPIGAPLQRRETGEPAPVAPAVPKKAAAAKAVSKAKETKAAPAPDLLTAEVKKGPVIENVPAEAQAGVDALLAASTPMEVMKAESLIRSTSLPLDEAKALIERVKAVKGEVRTKQINRSAGKQAAKEAKEAADKGDAENAAEARRRVAANLPKGEAKAVIDALHATEGKQTEQQTESFEDRVRQLGDDFSAAWAAGNINEAIEVQDKLYQLLEPTGQYETIMARLKRASGLGTKASEKQAARSRAAQQATNQIEGPKKPLTDAERKAALEVEKKDQAADRKRGYTTSAKAVSLSDANAEEILAAKTEAKLGDAASAAELEKQKPSKGRKIDVASLSTDEQTNLVTEANQVRAKSKDPVTRKADTRSQAERARAEKVANREAKSAETQLKNEIERITQEVKAKGADIGKAAIEKMAKTNIARRQRKEAAKKNVGTGQLDISRVLGKTTQENIDEALNSELLSGDPEPAAANELERDLTGRTFGEVVSHLMKNGKGENYKLIASRVNDVYRRLAAAGIKFNFNIVNIGDQVPTRVLALLNRAAGAAHYNPTESGLEQNVYINGSSRTGVVGMTHETILHELIHAVTQAAIYIGEDLNTMKGATVVSPEIKQLHSELKSIQQAFVTHFNKRIADWKAGKTELTELERAIYNGANTGRSVSELVAWGLTNQPFQEYLRGIQYGPQPQQNLLQRMFQAIAEYFGFKEQEGTAFFALLKATDELFNLDANRIVEQGTAIGLKMPKAAAAMSRVTAAQVNPENVTQRVSTNITSAVSTAATEAVRQASNFGDRARKFTVRLMSNDQLRQAAEKIDEVFGNAYFKVTDAIERMAVKGRKYMERGHSVAEALYKLRRKDPDRFKKFTELTMDATVNDVHPDRDLKDPIHSYIFNADGQIKNKYVQAAERHAELREKYLALVKEDPAYADVYQQAQGYFAEMQDAVTRANIEGVVQVAGETIKLPEGKTPQDLVKWVFEGGLEIPVLGDGTKLYDPADVTQAQLYRDALGEKLTKHLTNISSIKKIRGAYFPLMRRGNYVIQGYEKFDPMGGRYDRDEGAVYFNSEKEAQKFARTTDIKVVDIREVAVGPDGKRTYTDPEGNEKTYTLADMDITPQFEVKVQNRYVEFFESAAEANEAQKRAAASGDFEELSGVQNRRDQGVDLSLTDRQVQILVKSIQQREGLDDAQKKVLQDSLIQSAITLMQGTRVQHRRKPRRYVAGASDDLVQNTLDYSTSVGNYRAKQEFGTEISDGMTELRKRHDELKYAADDRTLSRDDLVAALEQRITTNAVMQDTGPVNKTVRLLLTLSFLDKLASPAYSLINAMQPWMVTQPILAAKYGWQKSSAALTQAYADIGGLGTVRAGLEDTIRMWNQDQGTDFITSYKDRLIERYPGGKGKQYAALLDYLAERGAIDPNAGMEIARLNETTNIGGRALNRAELISRAMPTAIEAMNRATTALAEYNLSREAGLSHEQAMKAALTQVNNTQGNYSATNAAPIFNHPLARIALQFKKYGQMMYHLIGQNVYHAFKGATPAEKAQARKALMNIAVVHSAMAGVLGLPLEPIKLLLIPIGLLGGPDYDDLEDELRQAAAKYLGKDLGGVLMKGLPRAVGFDLSSRVGLDSLLTFGGPRDNNEQGVKTWLFDTLMGAPTGLIRDWGKGIGEITHGNTLKGLELLIPLKVVADSLRAYREGTEGKISKAGRQTMEPTNAAEMGLRAFGLTPTSVAKRGESDRVFYREQKEGVSQRQEMMGSWLNAPKAERGRKWDQIRKWNEGKSEAQRITLEDLKRADKRRETEKKAGQIKDGYRVTKRDEDAYARSAIYR